MTPEEPTPDDLAEREESFAAAYAFDLHIAEVEQSGGKCPDPECVHNIEYVPDEMPF